MSNWDVRWIMMSQLVATWSKDLSKKVGAVIVDNRDVVRSLGWNGFPRNVTDSVPERHERPIKYDWTEHAERNAIYNAAANGIELKGCRIYITDFPCSDCARAIIQSGIIKLVTKQPDFNHPRWGDKWKVANEMLMEASVEIQYI
jgi:dCMP deaminase